MRVDLNGDAAETLDTTATGDAGAEPLEELDAGDGPTTAQLEARLAEERRVEIEHGEYDDDGGRIATDDDDDDDGDHSELVAPVPPTAEEIAAATRIVELERAQASFERKVRKILGDDVPLEECATCNGMGLVPPAGAADDDLRAHVHYCECEDCAGYGAVRTGSKVPGQEIAPCPVCGGRGYLSLLPGELTAGTNGDGAASEPRYGLEPWMGNPALGAAVT